MNRLRRLAALAALTTPLASQEPAQPLQTAALAPAPEDRYWQVETLPPPDGVALEVGGIGFLADGRMVVSTRRGEVWIVSGVDSEDLRAARFELFADGLFEGLGVAVLPGDRVFVLQRHELSELIDEDGDGRCDHVRTVADSWQLSGNDHEFAFGLPVDRDGGFFVALNLGFFDPYSYLGRAVVPYRGWVLRVSPDGELTPWASGFRSPSGVSLSPDGELFVTDNQGDWIPACPVHVVERGKHYGHPASLDWRPEFREAGRQADRYEPTTDVRRERAAVWLPYDLSRSTGNIAWDTTGGRFGPFSGQPFAAEVTNGLVLRMSLEKVRGRWQGASFAFRPGVGAANRIAFGPDGSMFCGLTSRGWGGEGAAHGLTRVRFAGELPMEMRTVALQQDGFEIEFTRPLAADLELRPEQVTATEYRYRYWWKYGSPEDEVRRLRVESVTTSADRRRAKITLEGLRPAFVARVELDGVVGAGGHALLHPRFDYTIAQLPDGPVTDEQVSVAVAAPMTREQLAARSVFLSDLGNTLRAWQGDGWELGSDPGLDPADPRRLTWGENRHHLVRPTGSADPLRSAYAFGDCTIRGEAMLAQGASLRLVLPCGDTLEVLGETGQAGQWVPFEVVYRGPRADAPAKVVTLRVGEQPPEHDARPALRGDRVRGPIGLIDHNGAQVALKGLTVTPDDLAVRDDGSFRGGDGSAAWKLGVGDWRFADGALVSSTGRSSAVRAAGSGDFAFEADFRLPRGGEAELRVLCSEIGSGGQAVKLNRSAADPQKSGTLVGAGEVRHNLVVYDDTWFRVRVEVRRDGDTDRVRALVNGVETATLDAPASAAGGEFIAIARLVRDQLLEVRSPWLERARD